MYVYIYNFNYKSKLMAYIEEKKYNDKSTIENTRI